MSHDDWSCLAGLRRIRHERGRRIAGWVEPVAYAVGFRSDDGWEFPYVNAPGGMHGLPAVILAEVLGQTRGTREHRMSAEQLAEAIRALAPAEEATDIDHPNLWAWRGIAAAAPRELAAVFIASLDDAPAGPADEALRPLLA